MISGQVSTLAKRSAVTDPKNKKVDDEPKNKKTKNINPKNKEVDDEPKNKKTKKESDANKHQLLPLQPPEEKKLIEAADATPNNPVAKEAQKAKEKEEQDRLRLEEEHKAAEALASQAKEEQKAKEKEEQDRLRLEQDHKAADSLSLQDKEEKENPKFIFDPAYFTIKNFSCQTDVEMAIKEEFPGYFFNEIYSCSSKRFNDDSDSIFYADGYSSSDGKNILLCWKAESDYLFEDIPTSRFEYLLGKNQIFLKSSMYVNSDDEDNVQVNNLFISCI